MKKIILSLFLLASFTFTFAQKANVSKAKNKALMENPDFAGAREAIKLALKDSTTQKLANTWYVAGLIGSKENESLYNKGILGMPFDADVKGQAILESYDYLLEAYKLDQLPDVKGKIKPAHTKDIKAIVKDFYSTPQNLIAYGAHLYEKKNYEGAIKAFDVFTGIPKLPIMNNEIPLDSTYNMITYYTAISCINAKQNDRAITILEGLKDKKYETFLVYQLLYEEYTKKNDTVNYVKTLKEGFEKLPSQAWFLQNLINYFIYSSKIPEAMLYLNTAIERDPNLAQYRFVKGNLEESLSKYDEAIVSFDKAIELDPTLADAYAGKGRVFYNRAVKMTDQANEIVDNKLALAARQKAEIIFKESIPFFLKAAELKPAELEYKRTLKILYYRLKMDKEFEVISKEIESM